MPPQWVFSTYLQLSRVFSRSICLSILPSLSHTQHPLILGFYLLFQPFFLDFCLNLPFCSSVKTLSVVSAWCQSVSLSAFLPHYLVSLHPSLHLFFFFPSQANICFSSRTTPPENKLVYTFFSTSQLCAAVTVIFLSNICFFRLRDISFPTLSCHPTPHSLPLFNFPPSFWVL